MGYAGWELISLTLYVAMLVIGALVMIWIISVGVSWGIRRALRNQEVVDKLTTIVRSAMRQ